MTKKTDTDVPTHAVPAAGAMDIPLHLIVADEEFNARKTGMDEDSIKVFARSLDEEGQLQDVIVAPRGDGKYDLRVGFRRFAAATLLKWPTIRAMLYVDEEAKDKKEAEVNAYFVNVAENVARQNLTPYDLAMRCKLLKSKYDQSGSDIARRIGKNVGYVNNLLNVVGEGEKGDGVIEPILRRWREECSWDPDSNQTRICKTDWLNRVRKLSKEEQLKELNWELYHTENPKVSREEYESAQSGGGNGTGGGNGPAIDENAIIRAGKAELHSALEAVERRLKESNVGKEETTRLNGVKEGLKFAIGVKKGMTNRIKGICAFKDGRMTEGAPPKKDGATASAN